MLTREEILKVYPEAVWFPGDPIPSGYVLGHEDLKGRRDVGVVVGVFDVARRKAHPQCPCCQCIDLDSPMAGWWIVECTDWWKVSPMEYAGHSELLGDMYAVSVRVPVRPSNATGRMLCLEYPPALLPLRGNEHLANERCLAALAMQGTDLGSSAQGGASNGQED